MELQLGIAEGDVRRSKTTPAKRNALPFFLSCTVQPSATFGELDAFIRRETGMAGHLSQFHISKAKGKAPIKMPDPMAMMMMVMADRDIVVAADDQFQDGFSDDEPSTTHIVDMLHAGGDDFATWEFDFGSPSYLTIVAVSAAPASTTAANITQGEADGGGVSLAADGGVGGGGGGQKRRRLEGDPDDGAAASAATTAANDSAGSSTATTTLPTAPGVGFDEVYPMLGSTCINEGAFVVGKGDHPYCIAYAFNCGGTLSDVGKEEPHTGINSVLEALEKRSYNVYPLEESGIDQSKLPSDAERAAFDFAALYPRIAKFVSFRGRNRFIQVGNGRAGPFAKAIKGDNMKNTGTVVWQSQPNAQRYNYSVTQVLQEMEANLPA